MGVDEWKMGGAQPGRRCRASSAAQLVRLTEQREVGTALTVHGGRGYQLPSPWPWPWPVSAADGTKCPPVEEQCSATVVDWAVPLLPCGAL